MSAAPERLRVFICHSSSDERIANELYDRLEADGFDPWVDTRKLIPGREWRCEIDTAVRDSHVVLVCMSENSVNKEGFVQKELRTALDVADEKPENTIFIIPVRLDDCQVPKRLQDRQWIDFQAPAPYDRLYVALDARAQQLSIPPRDPSLPYRRKYARHTHQIHFLYQDKPEDGGWETQHRFSMREKHQIRLPPRRCPQCCVQL